MSEKTYLSTGPIVPCVACWEVFADYDGYAPDTEGLVVCSTEELAKKVCELLAQVGPENDKAVDWLGQKWGDFPMPCVDGYQGWRRFRSRLTYRPQGDAGIATTVTHALRLFEGEAYSPEEWDAAHPDGGDDDSEG